MRDCASSAWRYIVLHVDISRHVCLFPTTTLLQNLLRNNRTARIPIDIEEIDSIQNAVKRDFIEILVRCNEEFEEIFKRVIVP